MSRLSTDAGQTPDSERATLTTERDPNPGGAGDRRVRRSAMRFRRIGGIWLLLCVSMIGNGIFRELALVPALKRSTADLVSAALGIGIVLGVSRPFIRPLAGLPDA